MSLLLRKLTKWAKEHANNIARLAIVIGFLLLAVWAITLESNHLVIGYSKIATWFTVALKSVGPELAGIVIGVVIIDALNERRQDAQLKRQLILQMGSGRNDVADFAIRSLAAIGWLYDGSLIKAKLGMANLENAYLENANLSGADLYGANLLDANLAYTNLQGTNLIHANLKGALLIGANLEETDLARANLTGAFLFGANLKKATVGRAKQDGERLWDLALIGVDPEVAYTHFFDADLEDANLEGIQHWTEEQLLEARTLKGATMPDGRKYEEWVKEARSRIDQQALNELDEILDSEAEEE
jgi:uncharacterized protein YjbI with pentapeptide repeats